MALLGTQTLLPRQTLRPGSQGQSWEGVRCWAPGGHRGPPSTPPPGPGQGQTLPHPEAATGPETAESSSICCREVPGDSSQAGRQEARVQRGSWEDSPKRTCCPGDWRKQSCVEFWGRRGQKMLGGDSGRSRAGASACTPQTQVPCVCLLSTPPSGLKRREPGSGKETSQNILETSGRRKAGGR